MGKVQDIETALAFIAENVDVQQVIADQVRRRREKVAIQEQLARPSDKLNAPKPLHKKLANYMLRPLDATDVFEPDLLCIEAKEAAEGEDADELMYALVRVWRSVVQRIPHVQEAVWPAPAKSA